MNCELCGKPDCGRLLPQSLMAECPYCFSILCCNCVEPTEEDPTPETDSVDTEYEDPVPEAALYDLLMQALELLQQANNGAFNGDAELMEKMNQLNAVVADVVGPVLQLMNEADDADDVDDADDEPDDFDAAIPAPEADPVSMGC